MAARVVRISTLRPGDRFSEIPAAWHGPGVVIQSSESGSETWYIKFQNFKVVNPPGTLYAQRETSKGLARLFKRLGCYRKEERVRLLGRFWRGEKGYRTY